MTVELSDALKYVGVDESDSDEVDFCTACLTRANVLVDDFVADAHRTVPTEVRDQATLDVTLELYKRKDNPTGIPQLADFSTGAAVMRPRDPLTVALPLLRRYVVGF